MADSVQVQPVVNPASPFMEGLGSFWTRIYSDHNFIRAWCNDSGMQAAQLYLDFMEALHTLGRQSMPVFHRERWTPMVIRRSERNTGAGMAPSTGMSPAGVIGPQPEDSAYTPGTEFVIGGPAVRRGFVCYPAHAAETFADGMPFICSAVVDPAAVYVKNTDYYFINGVVAFSAGLDPFDHPELFTARTVAASSGGTDSEIVLWGSDLLYDRGYTENFYGYLQSLKLRLLDYRGVDPVRYFNSIVNGVLGLRSSAPTVAGIGLCLGRLFNLAVIQNEEETVASVISESSGVRKVVTDLAVYSCGAEEILRPEVAPGAVLRRGEFLSTAVRFYRSMNPDRFYASNGYSLQQFLSDVPRLYMSGKLVDDLMLAGVVGFSVAWDDVPIVCGGFDGSGRPLLKFTVQIGAGGDDASYWSAVWDRSERLGADMSEILAEYLTSGGVFAEGMAVGSINPMRFFMRECFNSNMSVLVVDFTQLPEYIKLLKLLGEMVRSLPAHVSLFIISRESSTEAPYGLDAYNGCSDSVEPAGGFAVADTAGAPGSMEYLDVPPTFKKVIV